VRQQPTASNKRTLPSTIHSTGQQRVASQATLLRTMPGAAQWKLVLLAIPR